MKIPENYLLEFKAVSRILLVLAVIIPLSWILPPLPLAEGIAQYVPVHILLEFFSIIISSLVFAIVWNNYDKEQPANALLLACVFIGVAILDFLHTLSYQGMPDFITPSGAEKAIDFWLAARMLSALGLVFIAFMPWRPVKNVHVRWPMLAGVLGMVAIFSWIMLFHPQWTPHTFVSGIGLTQFKINSEALIILLYLIAAVRFALNMRALQHYHVVGLFAAACVMAMSELFFMFYSRVDDIFNFLGHVYKVVAYVFIYQSMFISSVKAPYTRLEESKNLLKNVIETLPLRVFWKDRNLTYLGCNTLFASDAGVHDPAEIIGRTDLELAWREQAESYRADDAKVMSTAQAKLRYEEKQTDLEGNQKWLKTSKTPLHDSHGNIVGMLGIYDDITETKLNELKQQFLQTAVDNSMTGFLRVSADGLIEYVNQYLYLCIGSNYEQMMGRPVWEYEPQASAHTWHQRWTQLCENNSLELQTLFRRQDGSLFPVELTLNHIKSDIDEYSFITVRDVSERVAAQEEQGRLTRSLALLSSSNSLLIHANNEKDILSDVCRLAIEKGGYRLAWVGFKDDGPEKRVLPVAQAGYDEGYIEKVVVSWDEQPSGMGPTGTAIREGRAIVNQDYLNNPRMMPWRKAAQEHGYQSSIALPLKTADTVLGALSIYSAEPHAFAAEEIHLLEELASDLAYGISTLRIQAEKQSAENKIEYMAYHDPLTGLPNRLLLRDRFEQAAAHAHRDHSQLALLFMDMDNFKHVNDSLGHTVGDRLLLQAAERFKSCLRETDTVSRLGGDEFVILLEELTSPADVETIVHKIMVAFSEPTRVDEIALNASFSIGVSFYPRDGSDFDEVLKQADTALYEAKNAGKNTFRFFSEQMNADAVENMALQSKLVSALENQELKIFYQPQLDTFSGKVIGAEALLRWQQSDGSFIPPDRFIPLAERSGLIIPIGDWVLREACHQAQQWRRQEQLEALTVAVNLSVLQFNRGNLIETVKTALEVSGLPAHNLELELTESILLSDLPLVVETISQLRELGVKISIDDFGTGYSSMSYLKQLPVDKLKIDKTFIQDMASDNSDAAIVKTVIDLGHALQKTIIAEGVETPEQLSLLKNFGCDLIQGYLFCTPVPVEQFCTRIMEATTAESV